MRLLKDGRQGKLGSIRKICLLGASLLALSANGVYAADTSIPQMATTQGDFYGIGPQQFSADYSKYQTGAGYAYSRGLTGEGQIIAVLDTGVDRQNRELAVTATAGYNALQGGQVLNDPNGHGTFVNGIIDSEGFGFEGTAFRSLTIPVQVLNGAGDMVASDGQLAVGIVMSFGGGARIFNNSWNTPTPITSMTAASMNAYMPVSLYYMQAIVNVGGVFVFAAGNEGMSQVGGFAGLPYLFPHLQPGWLAVVATDPSGGIAQYSNRCGVAAAYCLAAPGTNIVSTYGAGYGVGSGTSFAAPQVSAALALLTQEFPYLTAGQAAQILLATANKTGIYANQAIYGQGLLDIAAAVQPVGNITIPAANTLSGANVSITSSTAIGSASFAQSWAASVGPIMVVDSYGRSYEVDSKAFVTTPKNTFDSRTATQQYGFGEMTEYAPGVMGFWNDQYMAQPMGAVALTSGNGGKVEASTNIDPAYGFGSFGTGTVPAGALVTADGVGNPFMNLAEDATAAHVSLPMSTGFGDAKLNASVFTGYARTADLSARMTDPSYVAPTVSGGELEIMAPVDALDAKIGLNFGGISENGRLLGGSTSGAFGETQSTRTMFAGFTAEAKLMDGLNLIGGFEMGQSNVNQTASTLNVRYGALSSTSFHMGVVADKVINDKDKMGFVVSQPLRVSGGNVGIDVPTSRDFDGNVFSTHESLSAQDNGHETDLQGFYAVSENKKSSFDVGVLVRLQPDNVRTAPADTIGLVRYTTKF